MYTQRDNLTSILTLLSITERERSDALDNLFMPFIIGSYKIKTIKRNEATRQSTWNLNNLHALLK